jgi:hypothetical protein
MITFFTIPKPFVGTDGVMQHETLKALHRIKGCEVFLFGNDDGVSEAAQQYGFGHFPDIRLSDYGTPYLDDAFKITQAEASNNIICYLNSDIILYDLILDSIPTIPQFLMTGKRIDDKTGEYQKMYPGMDWFMFPKGMITDMPHFIVGRRGWDNWLVYHCRKRGIPVIDATGFVTAIHQNHDYNHVPESNGCGWRNCPESDYNLNLIGGRIIYLWELDDATHEFDEGVLVEKPLSLRNFTQGIILKTPEGFHRAIEPIYRCGHIARYFWLKVTM